MRHAYREMHSAAPRRENIIEKKNRFSLDLKTLKALCHPPQIIYFECKVKMRDGATHVMMLMTHDG